MSAPIHSGSRWESATHTACFLDLAIDPYLFATGKGKKERLEEFTKASDLLVTKKEEIQEEAKVLAVFICGEELIIYSRVKDEAIAIWAR